MSKKLFLAGGFILMMLLIAPKSEAQTSSQKDSPLAEVGKWFAAWETVSKDFYKINSVQPVEFVFFDERDVYSTSEVSVPNGELIDGPKLFGQKMIWKRAAHDGKVKLPDGQILPIGLMSFAAPLENQNAFFVMPLLDFWRKAGVESKEFGLENLVTGVFLHEFSHSQQMRNFGKRMSEFERQYKFETNFNDDIVQNYFKKNLNTAHFSKMKSNFFTMPLTNKTKLNQNFLLHKQSKNCVGSRINIFPATDGISRKLTISF